MPKVKVNDINIYYEIHGEGFPLVMIMGLSGNIYWWEDTLIEELSKNFKVVIFDNRGVGQTDKPAMNYSIKMFCDDTAGLMNELKIERAHVLGISMGGMIAQELVINYPEKVENLVLCSTHSGMFFWPRLKLKLLKFLMRFKIKTEEDLVDLSISTIYTKEFIEENPDYIEEVTKRFFKTPTSIKNFNRQLKAILKHNTRKRLKTIDKNTLIMHGKKDALISYRHGLLLADIIPYAKLALFENTAHALFSQEPERVRNTLLKFLI
ncbi:MAG: alpha/beta fold hydrolase [Promethearchaeota archaeon]